MLKAILIFLCFFSSLAMAKINNELDYQDEKTALHLAIFNQDDEWAAALIRAGVNTNIKFNYKDGIQRSLLYKLAHSLLPLTMKEYVKVNKDLNVRMDNNLTALMVACFYGNTEIAKILIDNNAELNLRDDFGNTAIFYAAKKFGFYNLSGQRSDEELYDYLQSKGASSELKNNKKVSAADQITVNKEFFFNMEKFISTLMTLNRENQTANALFISKSDHLTSFEITTNETTSFFDLRNPFIYSFDDKKMTFTIENRFIFQFNSVKALNDFKTTVIRLQKFAEFLRE